MRFAWDERKRGQVREYIKEVVGGRRQRKRSVQCVQDQPMGAWIIRVILVTMK